MKKRVGFSKIGRELWKLECFENYMGVGWNEGGSGKGGGF